MGTTSKSSVTSSPGTAVTTFSATRQVKKNLDRVMQEIRETKELYDLLIKSTTTNLSEQEKQKVQDQLLDIAKTIPALAIFVLPGGGLLLPILIKILPFNLLPSSFHEKA